jgi:hypothetical protein
VNPNLQSGLAEQYNAILCNLLLDLTSESGFDTDGGGCGDSGDDKDNDYDEEDSAHNDNDNGIMMVKHTDRNVCICYNPILVLTLNG